MPLTLAELARLLGADLRHVPDRSEVITGVSEPEAASPGQIALLTNPTRLEVARSSAASAFVVARFQEDLPAPQLVCPDPARALARLLELFHSPSLPQRIGVDERAAVDASAEIAPNAWVGPFAYVGPTAHIGEGSRIEPFSYVGHGVAVGERCLVGPGATLLPGSRIDDDVTLGPGAVVGYRGFGFWRDETGWHPIPSVGAAAIESGVELGANSCVDAGTLSPTRVGQGAQIDNLVQVGHNSTVAARALLCAQVGLAGSVQVGEGAQLGGQVGVADHRTLGRGCRVGAQSGIAQDVEDGATVSGYPAIPHGRWLRSSVIFGRLGDLAKQVKKLSEQVARLLERDS